MTEIKPYDELVEEEIELDYIRELFEGCDEEDQAVAAEKFKKHIMEAA
jgi:hypothetical protein